MGNACLLGGREHPFLLSASKSEQMETGSPHAGCSRCSQLNWNHSAVRNFNFLCENEELVPKKDDFGELILFQLYGNLD